MKANAFDFLMLNADSKQYIKESAGSKWSVALQRRHQVAVVMLCEQNQQRRSGSVQTEFIIMTGFTEEKRCALSLQSSPNADTARGCVPAVDTNKDWQRVATFSQSTKIKISKNILESSAGGSGWSWSLLSGVWMVAAAGFCSSQRSPGKSTRLLKAKIKIVANLCNFKMTWRAPVGNSPGFPFGARRDSWSVTALWRPFSDLTSFQKCWKTVSTDIVRQNFRNYLRL